MNYYFYKMEHDYGLAPNPFHGYCTLTVCKSQIRKSRRLEIGDWIIGAGSVALNNLYTIIFAMQVEEKVLLKNYWSDPRFQDKKPIINGSLVQMYGDNFYHFDIHNNKWIQENSAHSKIKGRTNSDHLKRDVSGENALISKKFYYFGEKSIQIPDFFYTEMSKEKLRKLRNIKLLEENIGDNLITWMNQNYEVGIHGDPVNWKVHLSNKEI
jgi:hypothetical protein